MTLCDSVIQAHAIYCAGAYAQRILKATETASARVLWPFSSLFTSGRHCGGFASRVPVHKKAVIWLTLRADQPSADAHVEPTVDLRGRRPSSSVIIP